MVDEYRQKNADLFAELLSFLSFPPGLDQAQRRCMLYEAAEGLWRKF
eukprot:gene52097-21944_t